MSIVRCRECGVEVSDTAASCPKCGVKNPSRTQHHASIFGAWLLIAVVAFVGYRYFGGKSGSSLPEPPIAMGQRNALTANSLVAIVRNTSDDYVRDLVVTLHDRDGKQIKRNRIRQIAPGRDYEIGPLEDWYMLSGYSMTVEIDGFRDKTWTFN